MPKEAFFTAISRWRVVSRRALDARVFGRASRSQPAALVSDRDESGSSRDTVLQNQVDRAARERAL